MALAENIQVGDIELIVLRDGDLTFEPSVFPDAPPDEVDGLMQQAGLASLPSAINAYLIRQAGCLTLVDCGPRDLMGATAGRLHVALHEADVAPSDIDRIIITHMHGDHVAGALDAAGGAVFSNASLLVHESDHAYFTDDLARARTPKSKHGGFDLARAVISAYGDRFDVYDSGADFGQGLSSLYLPGHTPGHSGLRLDSAGSSLLLVADIVHCQLLQLPRPEWGVVYDVDRETAVKTRAAMLDQLAADRVQFSGSHFEDEPVGYILRANQGYTFESE